MVIVPVLFPEVGEISSQGTFSYKISHFLLETSVNVLTPPVGDNSNSFVNAPPLSSIKAK